MKKIISILSALLLLAVLFFACSKENEQALQNNHTACDTTAASYSAHVKPILENECYACHTSSIASGGIVLDTYSGVKTVASNGRLVGAVTHSSGFTPMPLGRTKISDCNINTIKAWVNRGMVNN
jgi:uncharacterized membrane protein